MDIEDMQMRLLYGSLSHAEFHTNSETLPEFARFCGTDAKLLHGIYDKLKKWRNDVEKGQPNLLPFTEKEWELCKQLAETEAKVLSRMFLDGEVDRDLSGGFSKITGLLEQGYDAWLADPFCRALRALPVLDGDGLKHAFDIDFLDGPETMLAWLEDSGYVPENHADALRSAVTGDTGRGGYACNIDNDRYLQVLDAIGLTYEAWNGFCKEYFAKTDEDRER